MSVWQMNWWTDSVAHFLCEFFIRDKYRGSVFSNRGNRIQYIFYAQIRNLNIVLKENPLWNGYLTISHSCFHSYCRRKECLLFFHVPRSISQTCHIFHSIPYYVRKYWPRSKAFVACYRQYASAAIKTKNEWRLCRIVRNTVICHLNSYLILRCLVPSPFNISEVMNFFFFQIWFEYFLEYSNWNAKHNSKLRHLKK